MNHLKQSLLASAAVLTVGGGVFLSTQSASAQATGESLVQRLASTLNVSQDTVQAVIDEHRQERQEQRQEQIAERLQERVDSGNITVEQKTALEEKLKQMYEIRETEREALQAWATDNNIDLRLVMPHGHRSDSRLENAIEDGAITAEQKAQITAKLAELEQAREQARDELKTWAEENNISLRDATSFGEGGHGRGFGGGMHGSR